MAIISYLQKAWQKPSEEVEQLWRERLYAWRREDSTVRIDYPTRLDRARALGYRAKQGIFIVRQRIARGAHKRERWSGGRMSSNMGRTKELRKNYQLIAEERASKKFSNCEVLNSYYVANDGKWEWYEVILVEKTSTHIKNDSQLSWITLAVHKGRAHRGLTSAGRRMRGLLWKGSGVTKARPSRRAHKRSL